MNGDLRKTLTAVSMVWLPAIGTLYFALAGIWGIPNAEKVVGSIVAFDTFLGVVLRISGRNIVSTSQNPDGHLVVDTTNPDREKFTFQIETPMEKLEAQNYILLKVVPGGALPREENTLYNEATRKAIT
jgi:hypothetical protein